MTDVAILFDLDGTLVDTAPDFVATVNTIRSSLQVPLATAEEVSQCVNGGAAAMTALAHNSTRANQQQIDDFLAHYTALIGQQARLYPGLSELLRELEQHNIAWGIVTNKPRRFTDALVLALELRPRVIVCGDEVSAPKPDPESLQLASALLGIDTDLCIYCGDHERDIQAAHQAGMVAIAASYGYLTEDERAHDWKAHQVATSGDALARLLRELINKTHPNLLKIAS